MVAEHEGQLLGVIILSSQRLLVFLFTDAAWLHRGIARELWEAARMHMETEHPSVNTVELNSSAYAMNAYRALRFYPISEPFRRGGCHAIRMAYWLPGWALLEHDNAA